MSNMVVRSVTISLELADKEFGNGMSRFFNIKGAYQEGDTPLEEVADVVDDSLTMFMAAWKSLLGSKCAQGKIDGKTMQDEVRKVIKRTTKVQAYLRKEDGSEPITNGPPAGAEGQSEGTS
jgi:hypothetical protein